MVHLPDKYTDPHIERERHKTIIDDIKNEKGAAGFSAGNGTVVDGP